jgi:folate-binding protein YgfZ
VARLRFVKRLSISMSTSTVHTHRLGNLAIIDASGTDTESFLQGQFCNDLSALSSPGSQLTGYCTPKGRLLAAPLLQRLADESYRLVLPADLVETLLPRLRMFVMRAEVTFVHREDLVAVAVFDAADPLFKAHELDAPPEALGTRSSGDASVMKWDDPLLDRWLMVLPVAGAPPEAGTAVGAAAGATAGDEAGDEAGSGDEIWRLANIRSGSPSIVAATGESFVPQMMNFSEVGALSFTKGCYPGQEIVARTQYLGKLKKHMQRFVAEAGELPTAGDTLGDAGSADAGDVVDAVKRADGGIELLAVVRIERDAQAPLPLVGGSAIPAGLPYMPPGLGGDAEAG